MAFSGTPAGQRPAGGPLLHELRRGAGYPSRGLRPSGQSEASARTDYRLGFTSQDEETSVDRLPVTGELPAWLTGALVRVNDAGREHGQIRAFQNRAYDPAKAVPTVREHAQGVFDIVKARDGLRAVSQALRHPLGRIGG